MQHGMPLPLHDTYGPCHGQSQRCGPGVPGACARRSDVKMIVRQRRESVRVSAHCSNYRQHLERRALPFAWGRLVGELHLSLRPLAHRQSRLLRRNHNFGGLEQIVREIVGDSPRR